ncbi:hypothetical protein [Candidatus Kryptobacter tengchongensis]|uniref:hypothetical protein n=1 Tax=Kryptobacter tengchongensis TaxID=1643429 RepID=UPI0007076921|nr:hypothetical protein [Candidatus Kryptobacter tengchongensis]CUS86921.1 hypothetical protein JGI20_01082 [Candidatus Kryptobacter tengchongensis]
MAKAKQAKVPQDFRLEVERIIDERIKAQAVTKDDFDALKGLVKEISESIKSVVLLQRENEKAISELRIIVADLIEAQKRNEKSIGELRSAVSDLMEAQRRNEERFTKLEQSIAELIEAQKRNEERFGRLEQAVAELIEAQRRNEERFLSLEESVRELRVTVSELVEAQKRNEERFLSLEESVRELRATVSELVEAQKRNEERFGRLEQAVAELIEAQRRNEERFARLEERVLNLEEVVAGLIKTVQELTEQVRILAIDQDRINKQLGGLSNTIGYMLENESYKHLPALLERDFGIKVKTRLKRGYVADKEGNKIEVNIFGEAEKNGKIITIIGECKSQLSKNDVDNFIRKKLSRLEGVYPNIFPVMVVHMISEPDVEDYLKVKGIALYYSYDF